MATLFTDAELRDLQIWFNLSWVDPATIAQTPWIAELVEKGRDFSEDDKEPVLRLHLEQTSKVLPKYRELQQRGQAELVTSPYYHPILPLIANLDVARVARPDLAMPRRAFAHPEDAAEQLRRGIESHERVFGTRPRRGCWLVPRPVRSVEIAKAR